MNMMDGLMEGRGGRNECGMEGSRGEGDGRND